MAAKNGNFYSHQSLDGLIITAQFLSESLYMKEQAFQSFTVDTQGLLWILPDSCQAQFWQHLVHQSVPSIPFVMNSSHLGKKCACTERTKIVAVSCGTSRYSKTRYKKLFTH